MPLKDALHDGVIKMSNEYKDWLKDQESEINNFIENYCNWCSTQRCEGPETEWSKVCPYYIKYFEEPYETANNCT